MDKSLLISEDVEDDMSLNDIIEEYTSIMSNGSDEYWEGTNDPWRGYRYVKNLEPYGFKDTILVENVKSKYLAMLKVMVDDIVSDDLKLQIKYPSVLHEKEMGSIINTIMVDELSPNFIQTGKIISIPVEKINDFPNDNSLWTRYKDKFSSFYEKNELYKEELLSMELRNFFDFFTAKYVSLANEKGDTELADAISETYRLGNLDELFNVLLPNFKDDGRVRDVSILFQKEMHYKLVYVYAHKKFRYPKSQQPSIRLLELELLGDTSMLNVVDREGITTNELKSIIIQLINGLGALKIKNIIHRNISAKNILLVKKRPYIRKRELANRDYYGIRFTDNYYRVEVKHKPIFTSFERADFMRFSNDVQQVETPVSNIMSRSPETIFLTQTPILNNNGSDLFSVGLAIVDMITQHIDEVNRVSIINKVRGEQFFDTLKREYEGFCEEKDVRDVSKAFLCDEDLLLHVISLVYLLGWPGNSNYPNIEDTSLWNGLLSYLPEWLTINNKEGFLFTNQQIKDGAGDVEFLNLLRRMLSWNPSDRPDPLDIDHAYFNDIRVSKPISNGDTFNYGWGISKKTFKIFEDKPTEKEEKREGKKVTFDVPEKTVDVVKEYVMAVGSKGKKYKIKSIPKQKVNIIGDELALCQSCGENIAQYKSNVTQYKQIYVCSQLCSDIAWDKLNQ